jgi:hypothetical protein
MQPKPIALAISLLIASYLPVRADQPSPPATVAEFPFCAWWSETTATSLNVAFPDSGAAYWTTPFQASADLQSITVNGTYVDARYFSLNAYDNGGASYSCGDPAVPSGLADFRIAPDSGSVNPFVTPVAPGEPYGGYTVTLTRLGTGTPEPNTIPLYQSSGCTPAPSQGTLPSTLSFLIVRAYLPHDGFAAVKLPDVTLHFTDGHSTTLPQCHNTIPAAAATAATSPGWIQTLVRTIGKGPLTTSSSSGSVPCGHPGGAACPPDLTFFRPLESATGGLFPNVDNKYIAALVQPKPDTVVVIRAKAATFPPGMQALPWDPTTTELRYWSMCSNIYRRPWPVVVDNVGDQTILGCASDQETQLDASGYYTYVVSSVANKPSDAVLTANTATWLPFSNRQPYARHMMILRNMLGDGFPHSVQNCTQGSDASHIAACHDDMQSYYPMIAECHATIFE